MKILYNSKFLQHNPDTYAEGRYRIEEFTSQTEEVDSNGETYITQVHSESHLKLVRDTCMNHQVLAEVYLSPESYHAACSAVDTAISKAEEFKPDVVGDSAGFDPSLNFHKPFIPLDHL